MWIKPLGTLQVDVDDLWVYYESIGLRTPPEAPALAFTQGIPRLLDQFDRFDMRCTFFVCGRDLPAQAAVVHEIVQRGHEVANHSATHRNGYARLNPAELRTDIKEAGDRIAQATGRPPVGFKAPGFSFNPALPEILAELGYLYDSSLLPTFYAPVLRLLQGALSRGHVDPTHYGRAVYGFAPLRPWRLRTTHRAPRTAHHRGRSSGQSLGNVCEAPVTTVPLLRLPMHSTFVLAAAGLAAGRPLFDMGLALARLRRVPLNYLLHAADVLDCVTDPALASYRFLRQEWEAKRPLYEHILAEISTHYRIVPTQEYVKQYGH